MIDPKMLILDEPTEGIQPNIVNQIGDIITELNEELGLTVLLVERKLPCARRVFRIRFVFRVVTGYGARRGGAKLVDIFDTLGCFLYDCLI
jgi:ABC-type branched-subunit amino acid transport system ATPase component